MKKISLAGMVLVLLSLLFCAAAAGTIQVQDGQVSQLGDTATLAITLDSAAPSGLAGYDFNVSVSDPSVATITSVTFPSWAITKENSTLPAAEVRLRAVDLSEQINADATSVPLATITVRGDMEGTASITLTPRKITADGGANLIPDTVLVPGTFTVDSGSPTGSISVTSSPSGAAITLDGTGTGQVTPYTFDSVTPGDHTVAVSLDGYEPASQTVTVVADETSNVDFPLVLIPTSGSISVTSSPSGAAITLDGTGTGQVTPYTFDSVTPGDHMVAVSLDGYEPASQTVTVVADETVEASFTLVEEPEPGSAIIADHTTTHLAEVPQDAIVQAKENLHIAYGHTSHGSQITTGMTGLVNFAGAPYGGELYRWNNGGTNGALDLHDYFVAGDLGNPDRVTWAARTRTYLDANPDVNVVMWSWCGQVDTTEVNINTYLDLMSDLEDDYPDVYFVYMTGHLNGGGESGNVNLRNEQIRNYCRDNNKILFDFADIESYDPDAATNYMVLFADDGCNYRLDGVTRNWATEWQNSHPVNVSGTPSWYQCGAAHTQPLNANMKAYAAWWLFARLAGWDGSLPGTGSIAVTSTPAGAAITLDGTETGQVTPYTFDELTPSEHTVAVSLEGYEPASQIVSVTAGATSTADFTLVLIPTTGSIAVTSTPAGAAITLDGTETGQVTPYTFDELTPGDHTVAVNLDGYEPASQTVSVTAGATSTADFTLVLIPTTGSIAVTSTPAGAAITLDGTETGQITPYTFNELTPGDHTVAVNLDGYEPASQSVAVTAGATSSADFTLVLIPTTGSIAVTSTPAGAAITLDGTETGQITPYTFDELTPGDHTVAVNLDGYEPASQSVAVTAGATSSADFTLVLIPTTGSIAVTSSPGGAAITLDGTETGQVTPYTFDELTPGDHTVAVSLEGYESASQTVSVTAGATNTADFTLVLIPTTGSIAVTSSPAGAAITLDGTETGQITPYTFDELTPGDHTVAVSLEGYESASQTVSVTAGAISNADFALVLIPTTGSIAVTSSPAGAAITLDGTETGQVTPYTFDELTPGDHTVAVNLDGYEPASQTVSVTVGATSTADFTLVLIPTTGSIAVTSTPASAAITLDGAETGQVTPYTFNELTPGDHTVAVSLDGYEPASQTVAVTAGATSTADFTLDLIPTTGSIAVTSTPASAAITLDGTETGQITPYTFDELTPGDHTVAVNLEGYEPASQTVAVTAGATSTSDFTLVLIPTTGSIAVTSTPAGATITLDGMETGQVTPYTFDELTPGEHTVAVSLEGYEPASQTVAVTAGATSTADFTLVLIPTTGSIAVTSSPAGAAITLDGTETGQVTPYTFDELTPGEHTVAVNLDGYEPASQTVSVTAGATSNADFALVLIPTTGSIAVTSSPAGAAITLDGTETGQVTPYTFDELTPGDHTVAVNLDGYEPASQTVAVTAGATSTSDFTLVLIPTTGSIAVTSTPAGATITLDGMETGQVTPYTFDELTPGDHTVAVNLDGYEPASQSVAVTAGATSNADFALVLIPTTGSIAVTSSPGGAAITLDGAETGQVTPYTFDELTPGDHTVAVNLEGYEPASQTVSVTAGATSTADFTLVLIPTTGSIAVTSSPGGAAITLDGAETGQVTPYTFDELTPGDHTVAVNLDGYEPASQSVAVTAGATSNADFALVLIPTTGSIAVTSTPEGATITLDGTETGQVTPYTFNELTPGDHTVTVNLEGYEPASQTVSVTAGATSTADFTLVLIPTTGSIAVTSTPAGAAITLDGTETGQVTPYTFDELTPGDHTVAVNLDGYEPASQSVAVTAGATSNADFALVLIPTTGSIAVTSTPEGATITLDGTETGQVTPYTFNELTPGDHTVTVNLEGYEPASQTVSVTAGATSTADFTLVLIPTTGSIAVTSTPAGATITLDGTETGQVTPYTFNELTPGDHTVAVSLEGYEPASQSVAVTAGATSNADFALVLIPTTGSIAVTSTPAGATITLDGTDTGQVTPYTFNELTPGDHTVAVSLEGYEPASQSVAVTAGATSNADFALVLIPTTGSIAVTSTPAGATITLDGTDTGQVTPYTFNELTPGDHTVTVNLDGYEPASQTVSVTADETSNADFTLVLIPTNAPLIKKVYPNSGETGRFIWNFQINGANFQNGASVALKKDGQSDIVPSWVGVRDEKRINCVLVIPLSAEVGAWDVVVTNPDGQSAILSGAFTVKQTPTPVVKNIAPSSGRAGRMIWNLQVTGENFRQGATVRFQKDGQSDMIPMFSFVLSDKRVYCMLFIPESAEAGTWDVTVTNPDGQSATKTDAFTVRSDRKAATPSNNGEQQGRGSSTPRMT